MLEILRLRQSLVEQRTQVYNRLQALAHDVGLPKGRMRTAAFQEVLKAVEMDEAGVLARSRLFSLLGSLITEITELETWLRAKAAANSQVELLLTQPGVGYLTALATVHTVGDVTRFTRLSKQVAGFVGLDPLEPFECRTDPLRVDQQGRFADASVSTRNVGFDRHPL